MFGSNMIEVAIGLTFFYILLALISSTLNEWITMLLKLRAGNLEQGIRNLLDDPTGKSLAKAIYSHPLVRGLSKQGGRPSYISSKNFTRALLDIISTTEPEQVEKGMETIKKNLDQLPDNNLKKSLMILVREAGDDVVKARKNIESWYDESMERVSGWYKRKIRWIILGIALVVTVGLNADTFKIANTLYHDANMRSQLVQAANEQTAVLQNQSEDPQTLSQLNARLESLQLPIGWSSDELKNMADNSPFTQWILKIAGLLFTAFAVSLGAPFWFDMLNKFNSLRGSGGKPKTAEETT